MTSNRNSKQNLFLRILEESESTRVQRKFEGTWNIIFKIVAALYSLYFDNDFHEISGKSEISYESSKCD
jgi:hypothetical protein